MIHAGITKQYEVEGYQAYDGKTIIKGLEKIGWHPQMQWKYINTVCGDDCIFGDFTLIYAPIKCGNNVRVGELCKIFENCKIGDNVVIDEGCTVPKNTTIEDNYHWTNEDSYKASLR